MKSGYKNNCKQCCTKYIAEQAQKNPARAKRNEVKKLANSRGYDFDLTLLDFEVLQHAPCEYCGDPATGFDRVDSEQGYVQQNVTPCCRTCNYMKNALPTDIFLNHIQKINNHLSLTQEDQA